MRAPRLWASRTISWVRRVLAFGLLGLAACAGLCSYFGYRVVHPPRRQVRETPADRGLPFTAVRLRSRDGVRLEGWFVPRAEGGRGPALVVCHGHPDSRAGVLPLLQPLHEQGFHLLAFDFRALGESGGDHCTLGWKERWDVHAAVAWLRTRREVDPSRIGVYGLSMGGAAALLAAGENPAIQAVATDCTFARLDEMAHHYFWALPAPFRPPLGWGVMAVAQGLSGADASRVAPEEAAARLSPRPLLVIQSAQDRLVPLAHGRRLARGAGARGQLWIVDGAGHCRAFETDPDAYVARLVMFFQQALGGSQRGGGSGLPATATGSHL